MSPRPVTAANYPTRYDLDEPVMMTPNYVKPSPADVTPIIVTIKPSILAGGEKKTTHRSRTRRHRAREGYSGVYMY